MVATDTDFTRINIDTVALPMDALKVEFMRNPDECKSRAEVDDYTRMTLPDGRRCKVSKRFWISWCSLQNQGRAIFDLFSHAEVFTRIQRQRSDQVRIAIERGLGPDIGGNVIHGTLISCTNPRKPLLPLNNAVEIITKYDGDAAMYEDGVVTATFDTPFPTPYCIAGEDYSTQFTIQMPVDGYGMPQSYLTLLRQICTNGMIGMAKAFKTSFQLGRGDDDIMGVLDRAMTTFSAEEGFHSFRLRMEAAAKSWASLGEASKLFKAIAVSMKDDGMPVEMRVKIAERFDQMCGDPLKYYGLGSRDEVSARRARTVPVNTTMYELMTFASEVATHEIQTLGARNRINAWVGTSVSNEYDLESTCNEFRE